MYVIEPLNLERIFVDYLAGSMVIFFFIFMAVMMFLGAKLRMPNKVLLLMAALFAIMMAGYGFELIYALVIFMIGIFYYFVSLKITKG